MDTLFLITCRVFRVRVRPRFFDQVGHQTTNASMGNKHFFTNSCHHSDLLEHLKICTFKVIILCEWANLSKKKKISMKNIRLGDQLLIKNTFEFLIF